MTNDIEKVVLKHNLCISCGVCNHAKSTKFSFNSEGYLLPNYSNMLNDEVCPMTNKSLNEDQISEIKFSKKMEKTKIGYADRIFSAYRKDTSEIINRSSGGIITYLLRKLLEKKIVDAVITVFPYRTKPYFRYKICKDFNQIEKAATSAYYPVEVSSALNSAKKQGLKVAITGLPCTIKAINNLQLLDSSYKKNIVFTIALICGHLKTSNYLDLLSRQLPHIKYPLHDFRKRINEVPAKVKTFSKSYKNKIEYKETHSLYGGNYNLGFFQYNGCNYCDDVIGETGDLSVGDAWLPEYVDVNHGISLCVSRNKKITSLLEDDDLKTVDLKPNDVIEAQAGGYRQRREGLRYRLSEFPIIGLNKRNYLLGKKINPRRENLYKARHELSYFSHYYYKKNNEKLDSFILKMKPYLERLLVLQKDTFFGKLKKKFYREKRKFLKVFYFE